MPSVRLQFDEKAIASGIKGVVTRLQYKASAPKVKQEVTGAYAEIVAQYVPYKTGALMKSAKVVPDGKDYAVRYSAQSKKGYDYADIQYQPEKYGENESSWNRHTPGTYSHWNRHLTSADKSWFLDEATRIIKEGIKDGR